MAEETTRLRLRTLTEEDYPALALLMDQVYHDIGGAWPEETIKTLIRIFPEGQLVIEDNGELVATALTIKVKYDRFSNPHRYEDLITDDKVRSHNRKGDALYGLDVFVDKEYRGYRLGRRLYEARKELCREENLRAILAGGRLPGYTNYADQMPVTEYIEQVEARAIYDPILSFQLSNGFDVKRLMKAYLPEDEDSHGYATLLEWDNILYEPEDDDAEWPRRTVVRVGVVQRRAGSAQPGGILHRCVVRLSRRLRGAAGILQRPPHGPAPGTELRGSGALPGQLHRRSARRPGRHGGELQHQHRWRLHARHRE